MRTNSKWTVIRTTEFNRLHKAEIALRRVLADGGSGPVLMTAIGQFQPMPRAVPYVREWIASGGCPAGERQRDPAVEVVNL